MTEYSSPALTIQQQIDRLKKRGMSISDEARVAKDLSQKNYYRLKAYWLPFEDGHGTEEHSFRAETFWEQVIELYEFDREFRLLILSAVERIEVSLRTRWAHVLSLRYGSHAHENAAVFFNASWHHDNLMKLRGEYDKSREVFADHFREKHPELLTPPIWSTCELMSLGELSRWYGTLKLRADRQEIASVYGIDEMIIRSFLHHLTVVRNVCAHHSRLWNRKVTLAMTVPKKYKRYFLGGQLDKIYPTVVMLWLLLRVIEPKCNWLHQLKRVFERYPGVPVAAMGFPIRWREMLK